MRIGLIFALVAVALIIAGTEWLDRNRADTLRQAGTYILDNDTAMWADSKALAEEWLDRIERRE